MATAPFVKRQPLPEGEIKEAYKESLKELSTTLAELGKGTYLADTASDKVEWKSGQIYEVPLLHIRENPVNAREIYSSVNLQSLTESIKSVGQKIPAIGYADAQTVVLIDGHRRLDAATKLGLSTLTVQIVAQPVSDKELYLASRLANTERQAQSPLDDALVWRRLLDRKVFETQLELAQFLKLDPAEVSRTLAIGTLSATVIAQLSEYPVLLNYSMLNALREFEQSQGSEKTISFIPEIIQNGYGYREVQARRKKMEGAPRTRETPKSIPVTYLQGKGTVKTFPKDGRVELVIKGLNPEAADEFVTKLNSLFAQPAS